MQAIKSLIRNIPDFPSEGIQFKDITPVLQNGEAFSEMIEWYKVSIEAAGMPDIIAGIESRGFIMGSALADRLNLGFIPIRKPGKLPFSTHSESYELEYGTDSLEIHTDAVKKGQKVAIVDDLLATGGTAEAAIKLVQKAGGEVSCLCCLVELDFLKGREKLKPVIADDIYTLIHY